MANYTPDFEDIKTFLVTLWRPSASTAHDTVQVGHLNYLSEPERLVLILEGKMSRDELMTQLELKHNAKAIKRRVIEVINCPQKKKYRNKHHVQPLEVL
jgi:hypothetical protein